MSNAKLRSVLTIILIIFAVLPTLIVGLVGTFQIIGYENKAKNNTLEVVSLSKSSAVDELFSTYVADVSALSKTDAVVKAAKGGNDADSVIKAFTNKSTDILDTLILDASGKVMATVNGSKGSSFEHFNSDGMDAVSTVLSWENYGKTDALYVSREIYAEPETKTGGKVGYAVMVISLAEDSGLAKALKGTYLNGAHLALVDKNNNVLNYAGEGTPFVAKNGSYDSAFTAEITNMFAQTSNVSAENNMDSIYTNKKGKYAYACGIIPNVTTWRWVGIAESSTFSDFSFTTVIICWGVAIVACAVASVIAVVIISKFIGGMHDMLKTMNAISEGEEGASEIRFTVKSRKSELGEIQASFNELLDEVYLSEERHRTIAELSDNMLFEWDFHKERMYVSPNTLAKFEIDPTAATLSNGKFLDSLMSPEDAEKYKRDINSLLKNKSGYSAEYQLRAKSGAVIWISLRANCITDRLGEPLRVVGVMTDIDNEKKLELQLSERASYDFLSGLYNRSTFIKQFTQEIERRGQNKVCAMFLDVDDFKFINDRFGHTVGDEVIKFVADHIRTKVDDRGGFAGRFGGDEFVLCFTNQEDIE
ncbi:MAG: diguanylate cyclase domain-containing protein, partial [Oscillospiraceae bacterium]